MHNLAYLPRASKAVWESILRTLPTDSPICLITCYVRGTENKSCVYVSASTPSAKRKKMEHKNKRSYASVLVSNSQKKPSSTTTQSPVTTRSSMPSSSSTLSSKAAHFSHQFNSFSIIYTRLLAYKKLTVIFFLCPLRSPTSKDFINRTCSCGKIFFN